MARRLSISLSPVRVVSQRAGQSTKSQARQLIARIENLLTTLDPQRQYPEGWIEFALSADLPAQASSPRSPTKATAEALFTGKEIAQDLPGLIDVLCHRAAFTREELVPEFLPIDQACVLAGITRKTIERWRRTSLRARRVSLDKGCTIVLVNREDLNRLAAGVQARKIERRNLASAKSLSPSKPGSRARRSATAKPASKATLHRHRLAELAEQLRSVRVDLPVGVRSMLDQGLAPWIGAIEAATGLSSVIERSLKDDELRANELGWPDKDVERARCMAMWALRVRAISAAHRVDRTRPKARDLDQVITDLRWASRLKAELIRGERLMMLRALDGRLLASDPSWRARAWAEKVWRAAINAASAGVERFDPIKGGRLAGPVGLELNKVLARLDALASSPVPSTQPLSHVWVFSLDPWQRAIDVPLPWRDGLSMLTLKGQDRALILLRFGLGGSAPATIIDVASSLGKPPSVVRRTERSIEQRALLAPRPSA